MEIISTLCNVEDIHAKSGKYNIQKVTSKQTIPISFDNYWTDIFGSSIQYKAQPNSNKLNYLFNTNIIGDPQKPFKFYIRILLNNHVVGIHDMELNPMEQKTLSAFFQFNIKEFPQLWNKTHTIKTQIYTTIQNSALLHYTTTIIDRKFGAIFTTPHICNENVQKYDVV